MHTMFKKETGFAQPLFGFTGQSISSNESSVGTGNSGGVDSSKLGILQTRVHYNGTLPAMGINEDVSFATVVSREVLTFDYPTELPVNFPRLTFNGAQ